MKFCFSKLKKDDFIDVFSYCIGKMMVVQNRAIEYLVKEQNYEVVFSENAIYFGKDKYLIQFIGSESYLDNTCRLFSNRKCS